MENNDIQPRMMICLGGKTAAERLKVATCLVKLLGGPGKVAIIASSNDVAFTESPLAATSQPYLARQSEQELRTQVGDQVRLGSVIVLDQDVGQDPLRCSFQNLAVAEKVVFIAANLDSHSTVATPDAIAAIVASRAINAEVPRVREHTGIKFADFCRGGKPAEQVVRPR